jgi:hypothetical protein
MDQISARNGSMSTTTVHTALDKSLGTFVTRSAKHYGGAARVRAPGLDRRLQLAQQPTYGMVALGDWSGVGMRRGPDLAVSRPATSTIQPA